MADEERRQHKRSTVKSWYRIVLLDIDMQPVLEIATAGLDISRGGVGAIFAEPIAPGNLLAIQSFTMDGAGPVFLCEVTRCVTVHGNWNRVGMSYRQLSPEVEDRVRSFRGAGGRGGCAA